MNQWSQTSLNRLGTCHPDLQVLANAVLPFHDCKVITGHRGEEDQNRLYAQGKSKLQWPNGKHNEYPSKAIDLAPYRPGDNPWDYEYSLYFAGIVLGIADVLHSQGHMTYKVRWGGNWATDRDYRSFKDVSFYDGLHFELV